MAHKIKSPRPRELEENETFSSFECWKGTLEYYLGLDDRFAEFLDETFTWKPKGICPNRGLEDIKLENDTTITAAKRAKYLDIFLGLIIYRTDSVRSDQTEQILSVIVRFLDFASEVKNRSLAQLSFPIALITNSLYIVSLSSMISIVLARLKC